MDLSCRVQQDRGRSLVRRQGLRLLGVLTCCFALLGVLQPANATTYVYEDTTPGPINQVATPCAIPGALVRTITVTESFTITNVSVGLTVAHPNRGDVLSALMSPAGTLVIFQGSTGGFPANIDALFTDQAGGRPFNNGLIDNTVAPFYERPVQPDVPFANFTGENSVGVWTVFVCNMPTGTNGTYLQSRLVLEDAATLTPVCSGVAINDWATNGSGNPFASSTTNDITLTQTAALDPDGVGAGNTFLTLVGLRGAEPDFYSIEMSAGNVSQRGLQVDFAFDPPVYNLDFLALDIDSAGWDDLLRIDARDAAGILLPFDFTLFSASVTKMGDMFDGNQPNVTNPNIDGNIQYLFGGPVSSLSMFYMIGNDVGPAFQWSGLGDFSFCGFDYGDAPDSYNTLLGAGARHDLADRDLFLGLIQPDGEPDGQPGATATADGIEEDALTSFPGQDLSPGDTYSLDITVTNNSGAPGNVCGWVDFDLNGQVGDGTFDSDEGVCLSTAACSGGGPLTCTLDFTVPADFVFVMDEPTYARFRVTSDPLTVADATGRVTDGEVEDFQIPPNVLPVTVNWFDSSWQDENLLVSWQSAAETDTVGYEIWATVAGQPTLIRREPALQLAAGTTQARDYQTVLSAAELPTGAQTLTLIALSTQGRQDRIGAYVIGQPAGQRLALATRARSLKTTGTVSLPTSSLYVDLLTEQGGIHRVGHAELLAQGFDLRGVNQNQIALTHRGQPMARKVLANGGVWDASSYLDFFATAIDTQTALYSDQDVYRLTLDAALARPQQEIKGIPKLRASSYLETLWWGDQLRYGFSQPTGDPWYDRAILSWGAPKSVRLDLNIDDWLGQGPVYVRLELAGITNFPGPDADHEIEVFFDDQPLGLFTQDGLLDWQLTIPAPLTQGGAHYIDLVVTGDTGNPFDLVHLDRWGIEYRRQSLVRGDQLLFSANGGGQEVGGLSSNDLLAYARRGDELLSMQVAAVADMSGGWTARFGLENTLGDPEIVFGTGFEGLPENSKAIGPVYEVWVSTAAATLRPQIRAGIAMAEPPANPVDHLVIAPQAFLANLESYRLAREAEGFRVHLASTETIAAGHGHGLLTPTAIQAFLDAARPSGYSSVLLVGASTVDPMDRLGYGTADLIPAPYVRSHDLIYFTPSDGLLVDFDGDQVPDRAIGRWPVSSIGELDALVQKTADYAAPNPGALSAVIVAGDDPLFEDQSDQLILALQGSGAILDPIYLSTYPAGQAGIDAARVDLMASIDSGRLLTLFSGHGSPASWTFQNLLNVNAAGQLTNQGQPTVAIPLTCYSTYFVDAAQNTLGQRLVTAGLNGAAAVLGPATLSRLGANQRMTDAIIQSLRQGNDLGTALLTSKQAFAGRQGMRDAILNWSLLGDPLLSLPPGALQ